jgi:GTP cyclohydrolase IA
MLARSVHLTPLDGRENRMAPVPGGGAAATAGRPFTGDWMTSVLAVDETATSDSVLSLAVDMAAAERAVADLLVALGQDPTSESLIDTPGRVARAYAELLTPRAFDLTTFPNDEGYDELVLARDIPFRSVCRHHLLPFHGRAHVGYIPADRILGLSKLARVTDLFASDLQLQERLTQQIADWLQYQLRPRGVGVVIEAEHLCMSARGARAQGSQAITSAVRGALRDDVPSRQEFFSLAGVRR